MLEVNRRKFLSATLTAAVAGVCAKEAGARNRRRFFDRVGLPIGLQLYTLGETAGQDLDATFDRVAQIGYREIELPSLLGRQPGDIAAAAKRAGVEISSLHLPLLPRVKDASARPEEEARKTADLLVTLGAKWTVAPILLFPDGFRPAGGESMKAAIARSVAAAGEDIWKRTAERLNERANLLKPFDIGVAYHNHNLEFTPVGPTTGWDILWKETQPDLVNFEVDTGWISAAGLDVAKFIRGHRGRIKLLHVKDVAAGSPRNFALEMKPTQVGQGVLGWRDVLSQAYEAGVRHFYVEQEPPFAIPRVEAAQQSFEYLSGV